MFNQDWIQGSLLDMSNDVFNNYKHDKKMNVSLSNVLHTEKGLQCDVLKPIEDKPKTIYELTKQERKDVTKLLNRSMAGLNVDKACYALESLKDVLLGLSFEGKKELHTDILEFIVAIRKLEKHKKKWQNAIKNARYAEVARERAKQMQDNKRS